LKKVLIITYYWPPAGGPGVQRVLKFAKYLPQFGWKPIVLTVENGDYPALDTTFEAEIPHDIRVIKIPIFEPHRMYKKLMQQDPSQTIPVGILSQKNKTLKSKLLHWIRANLFVPDARIGWYFNVIRKARRIIQQAKVDIIIVSSPPHSLQLFGIRLKKITGIPLVSDFRDPWTDIHYYNNINRLWITRKIDAYFEKRVLEKTDQIWTISPALKTLLESKINNGDYRLVFNGFDEEDFQEEYNTVSENFVLSYVGNFKSNQNCPMLWKCLSDIIEQDENFRNSIRIEMTGKTSPDVDDALHEYGLNEYVINNGYKPHNEAIRIMRSSSVLLFIIPKANKNEGILTGKLFDYLASDTAFLSIGPPRGNAAAILENVSAGPMLDYNDYSGIRNRIIDLYQAWKDKKLKDHSANQDKVRKYNRKKITEYAAQLLDELVKRRKLN
jgi:hypothetical protein